MEKLNAGTDVYNKFLEGGYDKDIISCFYGPGGSGKTLSCMLATIETALKGKKVIFIDTEQGFSVERLMQITIRYNEVLKNVLFFKPKNFDEFDNVISNLKKIVNDKIGLIVVDTVSVFYRLEMPKQGKDPKEISNEFVEQTKKLSSIVKENNIPVLLTTQVYADFEKKDGVKIIGGFILKNRCRCIIELEKLHGSIRRAILRRYKDFKKEKDVVFEIVNEGIKEVKYQKEIAEF